MVQDLKMVLRVNRALEYEFITLFSSNERKLELFCLVFSRSNRQNEAEKKKRHY